MLTKFAPNQSSDWLQKLEETAINKSPHRGKCPESPFRIGWHRVGIIPLLSMLDGGAPGDIAYDICLHCGKVLGGGWFVVKDQPRKLGG